MSPTNVTHHVNGGGVCILQICGECHPAPLSLLDSPGPYVGLILGAGGVNETPLGIVVVHPLS